MAKRSMVLKLTNINQTRPEGVTLEQDNSWKSPGGGWLPVQAGVWDQVPDGVHLHDPPKKQQAAVLRPSTSSPARRATAAMLSIPAMEIQASGALRK
jgi:hypothetical protein